MISFFIQCLSSSKIVKNINILLWRRVFNFSHILLNLANFSPESTETCEKSLFLPTWCLCYPLLYYSPSFLRSPKSLIQILIRSLSIFLFFSFIAKADYQVLFEPQPNAQSAALLFLQLTDKIIAWCPLCIWTNPHTWPWH